jgi:serine/threonine protein kinase
VDLTGKTLGAYRIQKLLGEGGMGSVWLAEHTTIGRRAAIKVLLSHYAAMPSIVERFFNEARAANQIRHPGIVEIFDFGEAPGVGAYLVMELLEGESLQDRLDRRRRMLPGETSSIVQRLAAALGAAHTRGIIHRDLKPPNVYIVNDPDHPTGERVKVLDFGIAKLTGDPGAEGPQTRTGAVMGTPTYMSPEQCHGAKNVDARSDIYALGIIAYEMLAGRPPFLGTGFGEMTALHMSAPPPALRAAGIAIPPALEAAVLRALAKDPDQRFQTMEAFGGAISAAASGVPMDTVPGLAASPVAPAPRSPTGPTGTIAFDNADSLDRRPTTLSASAAEQSSGVAPTASRRRQALIALTLTLLVTGGVVVGLVVPDGDGDAPAASASADEEPSRMPRATKRDDDVPRAPDATAAATAAEPEPAEPETAAPLVLGAPPAAATAAVMMTTRATAAVVPVAGVARPFAEAGADRVLAAAHKRFLACGRDVPTEVAVAFEIDRAGAARRIVPKAPHVWSDEGTCITSVLASLKFAPHDGPPAALVRNWKLDSRKGGSKDAPKPDAFVPVIR